AVAEERAKVAAGVLQELLQAEDLPAAVKEHLPSIDETLLMLMQHNIEAAREEKNEPAVSHLEELRAAIMQTLHESAPPEIRFVNELLALETDEEAEQMIKRRVAELNAETLSGMKSAAEQLRASSRPELADKLDHYRTVAEKEITAAKWR
ncbi:MAG: hypothetical protein QF501_06035, partial [Anaerolineales bacterium]|nr:hypothetical protein [Anaerolineales bacterium]